MEEYNMEDAAHVNVGKGLEPVLDRENLFMLYDETKKIAGTHWERKVPLNEPLQRCDVSILETALKQCLNIPSKMFWRACLIDYCSTQNVHATRSIADAEYIEDFVSPEVPRIVGHGQCMDKDGNEFKTIKTKNVRDFVDCMLLLHCAAAIEGVYGGQLQVGGTCELCIDESANVSEAQNKLGSKCRMGHADIAEFQDWKSPTDWQSSGKDYIANLKPNNSWTCWALA